jgi:hypothetical protein
VEVDRTAFITSFFLCSSFFVCSTFLSACLFLGLSNSFPWN